MTKEQLIAKYGIEWYEAKKARLRARYANDTEFREEKKAKCNAYGKERYANDVKYRDDRKTKSRIINKERYANDTEFREEKKAKCNAYCKERYVIGGRIDLVENYDKAKADNFKDWYIHHRDEIRLLPSDMLVIRTKEELIENGRYYNCPPNELIWMRQSEHVALHNKFRTR